MDMTLRSRGVSVMVLAIAMGGCSDGGAAAPGLDAAEDAAGAPDAAVPPDAVPPDAGPPDAAPVGVCEVPVPAVTAPLATMPPFVWYPELAHHPSFLYGWHSLMSLTTTVPLASLHLEFDSDTTIFTSEVLTCNADNLATRTFQEESNPSLASYYWTEADVGSLPPGHYVIHAAQMPGLSLTASLRIHGIIPTGTACTDPLYAAGVLSCDATSNCVAGVCVRAACSDGVDNDGDGAVDAGDPGCATATDDDEADTCLTGGACAACADGADNDGDGATDAPTDHGCQAAGDPDERNCPDPAPVIEVGGGGTFAMTGATTMTRGCRRWTFTGPERMFHVHLSAPGPTNRIFFNGALWAGFVVYQDTCDGPGVRCITITPEGGESADGLLPGDYYVAAIAWDPVSIAF